MAHTAIVGKVKHFLMRLPNVEKEKVQKQST